MYSNLPDLITCSVSKFGDALGLFRHGTTQGFLMQNHPIIDQARNALDHVARVVCVASNKSQHAANRDKAEHHMERLYLDALKVWHYHRLAFHRESYMSSPSSLDCFRQYINYEQKYCLAKSNEMLEDSHDHRIFCYSGFGGISIYNARVGRPNRVQLDLTDVEKLIRCYWHDLKPLISDYEVKTRCYFMDAARACVSFWEFLYGDATSNKVAENFCNCCWKILLVLIHYEYRIHLSYQRFRKLKLNDAGVGTADWQFAKDLHDILGEGEVGYGTKTPELTVTHFVQIKQCVAKHTGIEVQNVVSKTIKAEFQKLYNTIKTVREAVPIQ